MEYCTSLFTAETVERWSQQFVLLLHQLAQASETHALTINNLSLMPETELDLVQGFSIGEERPEYLSAPLIHEAFDAVAASSPTQRCLCYEGEWLNYLQASQRVSQLADHLIYAGVKPGVVVAIMLERSFDLVVSIMAVFKAGGCYLPCDPSYPDDRLAIYLEDAAAKIVLVQEQYLQRAESMVGAGVPVLDVSLLVSSKPHEKKGSAAVESAGPEDPAYIIFTSGSTGRPKAVVIPHRGVRDLMPCLVDQFKLNSTDTIIFANTINFDASIIQALPGLTVGAGLVIAKPEGHLDASYIVQLLLKNQVTGFICTVPTLAS
jgi:nonribosomal peptide synthetase DhbF